MDDTVLWKEAAKWLWTVFMAAGAWIFNKQDSRIKNLEDSMYTKSSAKERQGEIDKVLEDRRQDVIQLHAKIEKESDKTDDRFDKLSSAMHAGFSEIKTILLNK